MLISELRDKARRRLLDFTWRQWAQAGLSANIVGLDRWAIDPEALILFTIQVARRDPRLFDELLDWIITNRRLLSMQRLRNLTIRFPVDPELVRAVLAWAGGPTPKMHGGNSQHGRDGARDPVPLFGRDILSFVAEPDPVFAASGYIRPRSSRSGKSHGPDSRQPANLAFQLRHLFGPGSRSEVMRVLLTTSDGALDVARIADEAAFAKRNINDTLASLADSRVVKARWSGNERVFLAYRDKWAALLEVGPTAKYLPSFVSWVHRFPVYLEILSWLEIEADSSDSEYLISSRARDLTERVAADLETGGPPVPPRSFDAGAAYLPAFEDMVDSLLLSLGAEK
jgi:hypothetical protein